MPSLFLQAVYLIGVTDFRLNFNNSINPHWITTKIGTKMCFNLTFMCAKFQFDWYILWLKMQSVQNEKDKWIN